MSFAGMLRPTPRLLVMAATAAIAVTACAGGDPGTATGFGGGAGSGAGSAAHAGATGSAGAAGSGGTAAGGAAGTAGVAGASGAAGATSTGGAGGTTSAAGVAGTMGGAGTAAAGTGGGGRGDAGASGTAGAGGATGGAHAGAGRGGGGGTAGGGSGGAAITDGGAADRPGAADGGGRPARVLLYSFSTLDIPSVPAQLSIFKQKLEGWQYQVDQSKDPAVFTDANLARYAAVGMINTCFYPFGANNAGSAESQALQRFLQAGGGVFGTHCADVTFQSVNPPPL